jgi:PadR family transcriptional regulator PadR
MSNQQLKGHLEGLIMATLESGPAHGYLITESLRAGSGGLFDLPEGTIYPALHRLEDAGFIKSTYETVDGRQRRVYRLAPMGRKSLEQTRVQWKIFASAVTSILTASPA